MRPQLPEEFPRQVLNFWYLVVIKWIAYLKSRIIHQLWLKVELLMKKSKWLSRKSISQLLFGTVRTEPSIKNEEIYLYDLFCTFILFPTFLLQLMLGTSFVGKRLGRSLTPRSSGWVELKMLLNPYQQAQVTIQLHLVHQKPPPNYQSEHQKKFCLLVWRKLFLRIRMSEFYQNLKATTTTTKNSKNHSCF